MGTESMRQWTNLVQEATEGSRDLDRAIESNLIKYGQEGSRFGLPNDYPQLKTAADLLATFDKFVDAAKDQIEDPLAASMLSRLTNLNLERMSIELDRLARAPNPKAAN
jgi:hypothetical protein